MDSGCNYPNHSPARRKLSMGKTSGRKKSRGARGMGSESTSKVDPAGDEPWYDPNTGEFHIPESRMVHDLDPDDPNADVWDDPKMGLVHVPPGPFYLAGIPEGLFPEYD